ncbi:outer plastidial membrane protein porin-like isoform X2 [Ananas comosus]|uniref:Outer plastidial membrane protein porin-like isoform X2 n=1 Tax=Ananas comosus TaxID=4615 RepID=A0A6P5FV17_ANACO|nr:outer plastidial membrane protein porin-like isoform X2 [Ananas comosus]
MHGPRFYSDIGKRARDLLYDGFFWDQKLKHCTYFGFHTTENGAAKYDFSLCSKSKPQLSLDEMASGELKTTLCFEWPQWSSSKVEFRYLHDYAGIDASIGLGNPMVGLAAAVGTDACIVGADMGFDMSTGKITRYNARLGIVNDDLIQSVALSDKGDNLSGSCYFLVNPKSHVAVGGELSYRFSTNQSTVTYGAQLALDPCTMLKVRVNNQGKIGALIRYNWHPKSYIAISGEIDRNSVLQGSKIGLHLVL